MIKVCDTIMGTGKSESAITLVNEHPDERFIYISPYLHEAERIKTGCTSVRFVEPSDGIKEYNYTKAMHTHALIAEKRNVASTHQAFKFYTKETLDLIRENEYTLIIDENVDTLSDFEISVGDLMMAVEAGYLEPVGDTYRVINTSYDGSYFHDMFRMLESRELIKAPKRERKQEQDYFYWQLPIDLITAFKNVYILTYLFEEQNLCYLLKMHNIEYKYIGVEKTHDGKFHFTDGPSYIPEYVFQLPTMIELVDKPKLNRIGESPHALSMNWFNRCTDDVKQLKNNVYNCYSHIWKDQPKEVRMWGTYKNCRNKIRGLGYTNAFVVFNEKALNCYRDRTALAYCANPFMNVGRKAYYTASGITPNEDLYSLSILIQWIWRSAIRDGKPIKLYLPSSRMRKLLTDWMDVTTNLASSKGVLTTAEVIKGIEQKKAERVIEMDPLPPANCFIKRNQWDRRLRKVQAGKENN